MGIVLGIGNRALGWDLLPPSVKERWEYGNFTYAAYHESPAKWATGSPKPAGIGWVSARTPWPSLFGPRQCAHCISTGAHAQSLSLSLSLSVTHTHIHTHTCVVQVIFVYIGPRTPRPEPRMAHEHPSGAGA